MSYIFKKLVISRFIKYLEKIWSSYEASDFCQHSGTGMWTWSYTASYVHYTMINICFLPKPYAANECKQFWHKCCQGFTFRKFKHCRSKFWTNHLFFKSVSMQHKTRQLVCVSDGAKALSNLYGKYRYQIAKLITQGQLWKIAWYFVPGNSSRSLPMICDPNS